MSKLKQQMREDKALRDTAHSLIVADVAHVRNIMNAESLGKRIAGRIGDGASDVLHKAGNTAGNNRGILAAVVAAAALWFARKPILELLSDEATEDLPQDQASRDETDPVTLPPNEDRGDRIIGEDHEQ